MRPGCWSTTAGASQAKAWKLSQYSTMAVSITRQGDTMAQAGTAPVKSSRRLELLHTAREEYTKTQARLAKLLDQGLLAEEDWAKLRPILRIHRADFRRPHNDPAPPHAHQPPDTEGPHSTIPTPTARAMPESGAGQPPNTSSRKPEASKNVFTCSRAAYGRRARTAPLTRHLGQQEPSGHGLRHDQLLV